MRALPGNYGAHHERSPWGAALRILIVRRVVLEFDPLYIRDLKVSFLLALLTGGLCVRIVRQMDPKHLERQWRGWQQGAAARARKGVVRSRPATVLLASPLLLPSSRPIDWLEHLLPDSVLGPPTRPISPRRLIPVQLAAHCAHTTPMSSGRCTFSTRSCSPPLRHAPHSAYWQMAACAMGLARGTRCWRSARPVTRPRRARTQAFLAWRRQAADGSAARLATNQLPVNASVPDPLPCQTRIWGGAIGKAAHLL